MSKKCIHLIPHTHWDREWYFTSAKSKIYLSNNMKEILNMLEAHEDYPCYVLDGQTVVLEDYLPTKPHEIEQIKNFTKSGRLAIGPWYTQTDEMVVGGESIVRNLLYGKQDCDKFGSRMEIAYLPDSFGQSAAMPKILSGFGIKKSMFWRGYSERLGITQTEFLWEGDDGSKVVVQLLPINYSVGLTIPDNVDEIHKRFDKCLPILSRYSSTGHLCVPNGHDQMPVQQNIFEIIEIMRKEYPDYDVKLSSYEELYNYIDTNNIKTLKGEFLDGKYMRVHRSIYSSRADLKTLNTQIENKITNVLEPICSIAYTLGYDYQTGTIEKIWREMLKNHAHDSIGCCNTDKVNKQVERRFEQALDMVDNLIEFYMKKIVNDMNENYEKIIVFNTLPEKRRDCVETEITTNLEYFDIQDDKGNNINYVITNSEEIVSRESFKHGSEKFVKHKITLIDKLPAMGYKIYKIIKSQKKENSLKNTQDKTIENEYFKLDINDNGSINITDKKCNITYDNVLLFEDSADGGDSYDYSPIKEDLILKSNDVKAKVTTHKTDFYEEAIINFTFDIPKDIESRKLKKIDGSMDIELYVRLENSPFIKLSVNVDNHAKDHRVRLHIPQKMSTDNSIADIQFGKIKRNVYDDAQEVWEEENWDERPDTIYPFLSYVHTDNKQGIAVLSNSVREYQIIDGAQKYDTIAITLFRSYGQQGRWDLLRRPGRASGAHALTPDAQLIKKLKFDLALTTDLDNVAYLAKYYTTPLVSYSTNPHDDLTINKSRTNVLKEYSLLNIEKSNIVLSTLKKSEDNEGLCLRLYNTKPNPEILNMSEMEKISAELMLDETIKNKISNAKNIEFGPFEVKTLLVD